MASDLVRPLEPARMAGESYASVGRRVADVAFDHPLRWRWWLAFAVALGFTGLLAFAVLLLLVEGIGVWGNNVPVTWALDIVSYDWWIGVASGGLLMSATFLLLGSEWRGALNRITETGALLAAAAAAVYPIIHLGRPWFFYWNLPYPNTLLLWPQFRSPLFWDAVDIVSFLGVAFSVWSIGILPDLATLRDRAIEAMRSDPGRGMLRAQLYGIASMGWRGSATHWHRWRQAYRVTALLACVLVVSLQTGAAVMFAGSVEPGWHDTLLPVAFLAAAIFSGVAFMSAAAVVLRSVMGLESLVTAWHFDILARLLLGLGLANLYCTTQEAFTTLMGGSGYETAVLARRFDGPHAWALWTVVIAALLPVHLFWFRAARRSGAVLLAVGLLVSFGLYADHVMVIVVTLQHDFLPSAAQPYAVNLWEVLTFLGSLGLFATLALLALRYVPLVSIVETRQMPALAAEARRGR